MQRSFALGMFGLLLAAAACTSLAADTAGAPPSAGPTRTDPQGTIGGGAGEFGGPPGPVSGGSGARKQPAGDREPDSQQEPAPRRFGSCGPG